MKLVVGQVWCVRDPSGAAYFLITRYSQDNRGWMALTLCLGDTWLPYLDGQEIVFHIDDDVQAPQLELVCDAAELPSGA